jgi:mono/diheme cytochrome c family protein
LEALLAGRQPIVAATDAPGCRLDLAGREATPTEITYHNRVSRIVQRHCVECHRDGGVAPFSLTGYDDVVEYAPMIEDVVQRGVMPPWFAAPPENGQPSPWANDRSLSESEKADLFAWISGGQSQGDERDAPQPRSFPDGWLIGKPDAVFEMPKAIQVPATGVMPYQYVEAPTHLTEDRWVQAIEVQPGNREVVHHVLVFDVVPGEDDDRFHGGTNGFFGAYVPGNSTLIYPEGYARRLRKGSVLRFQLHYTPSGRATEDRTRIGLVFAKGPPRHEVHVAGLVNPDLEIPPHADNHSDHAAIRLPTDIQVLSLLPHMHLRGKACRYESISPDGRTTTLLDVPHYDFNWQLGYRFAEPPRLPAGTTLKFTAWYDNSDKNPANPDPSQTVRWGEQTSDEMLLGYVEYIVPGAKPGESPPPLARPRRGGDESLEARFARLDRNRDGKLTREELPRDRLFQRLDQNGDSFVTLEEARGGSGGR